MLIKDIIKCSINLQFLAFLLHLKYTTTLSTIIILSILTLVHFHFGTLAITITMALGLEDYVKPTISKYIIIIVFDILD